MKTSVISGALLAAISTVAQAHFLFVLPEPEGKKAKVILSEDLKVSEEVNPNLIAAVKLSLRNAEGQETPLHLVKTGDAYVTELDGKGARLIHGVLDFGWTQRGTSTPHVLIYYPKTIVGDAFDKKAIVGASAPVELIPVGVPGALKLQVIARSKPLADTEITLILPDGTQKKVKTDAMGETGILEQSGRYGAWARYWEKTPGDRDGKHYEEVRNYATLVFDAPAPRFATLPQATSSFGAVASDGWLYVYGGHISPTHSYSTAAVSGRFDRLKITGAASAVSDWEQLPGGQALQGMNLAARDGKIYLIGGMSPKNKPDQKADTRSVANTARFDPATMKWESLPSLPEPRSSHDVVVVGNKLFVLGGWTLKGPAPTTWLETMNVFDLSSATPQWKTVSQPFKRRALIAAVHSGKIYVIGGFNDKAEVVREVAIYDPATDRWTKGPELPGDEENAFAPAACEHDGDLYVSMADGGVYRLDESKQIWQKAGSATPRLAHRIVSDGKAILVIGGAAKGRNFDLIEAVTVAKASQPVSGQ
jgi:uncharacterized GH25 family protein